jgi:hypothetical protein
MRQAMFVGAVSFSASVAVASLANGQTVASCPVKSGLARGPGTIVGTVSDTSLLPLDSVDVFIASPRKQTVSADGMFRLEKLDAKPYQVVARRFGYAQQIRTVTVGDSGGVVAFCLVPTARTLATVISSAPRGGLMGVIADTAFGIIPGADVSVLGGGEHTVSDSTGVFYVPLKPGKYMVRVTHTGFESKMVSISVPSDSGRKMLIWLLPSRRGTAPRESWNADELGHRLDTASAVRRKIFTREDINNFGGTELRQLAQAGAVSYVDDSCAAVIDGGPYRVPIWTLKAADLEMVEVYTDKEPRNYPTSISNQRRPAKRARCPHVYAWLRKP